MAAATLSGFRPPARMSSVRRASTRGAVQSQGTPLPLLAPSNSRRGGSWYRRGSVSVAQHRQQLPAAPAGAALPDRRRRSAARRARIPARISSIIAPASGWRVTATQRTRPRAGCRQPSRPRSASRGAPSRRTRSRWRRRCRRAPRSTASGRGQAADLDPHGASARLPARPATRCQHGRRQRSGIAALHERAADQRQLIAGRGDAARVVRRSQHRSRQRAAPAVGSSGSQLEQARGHDLQRGQVAAIHAGQQLGALPACRLAPSRASARCRRRRRPPAARTARAAPPARSARPALRAAACAG